MFFVTKRIIKCTICLTTCHYNESLNTDCRFCSNPVPNTPVEAVAGVYVSLENDVAVSFIELANQS